jgi:hypothetical protein
MPEAVAGGRLRRRPRPRGSLALCERLGPRGTAGPIKLPTGISAIAPGAGRGEARATRLRPQRQPGSRAGAALWTSSDGTRGGGAESALTRRRSRGAEEDPPACSERAPGPRVLREELKVVARSPALARECPVRRGRQNGRADLLPPRSRDGTPNRPAISAALEHGLRAALRLVDSEGNRPLVSPAFHCATWSRRLEWSGEDVVLEVEGSDADATAFVSFEHSGGEPTFLRRPPDAGKNIFPPLGWRMTDPVEPPCDWCRASPPRT